MWDCDDHCDRWGNINVGLEASQCVAEELAFEVTELLLSVLFADFCVGPRKKKLSCSHRGPKFSGAITETLLLCLSRFYLRLITKLCDRIRDLIDSFFL